MANKALATRQRMQFRVEPSQSPARGKGSQTKKVLPAYLARHKNTKTLSSPATIAAKITRGAGRTEEQENN